jgi:hypothetical protein
VPVSQISDLFEQVAAWASVPVSQIFRLPCQLVLWLRLNPPAEPIVCELSPIGEPALRWPSRP